MENSIDDKKKFATVIKGLAGNFGGKVSKDDLRLRFTALIDYSIADIGKAGTWLLKHREKEFPPVPTTKEIIDAIDKVSGKLETKTKAGLECDKVIKALNYFVREFTILFKDKTTQYLMTNRWTFYQLGMMKEEDLKWWRKDFVQAYEEIDKQEVTFLDVAEKCGMIPASDLKKLLPEA